MLKSVIDIFITLLFDQSAALIGGHQFFTQSGGSSVPSEIGISSSRTNTLLGPSAGQ